MKDSPTPKKGLIAGRTVNPAKKVDMKGFVGRKGENLAGTPRSANMDPRIRPGQGKFKSVTKIKGQKDTSA
jgi:hypothetical protein